MSQGTSLIIIPFFFLNSFYLEKICLFGAPCPRKQLKMEATEGDYKEHSGEGQEVFLLINHHCKSLSDTWIIWLDAVMVWIWLVSHRLICWGRLVHSWWHCLGSRGVTEGGRSLGNFVLGPPSFLPLPGCFRWAASTSHTCCHGNSPSLQSKAGEPAKQSLKPQKYWA